MIIDGVEYLPDYRGRYHCPFEKDCSNPNYPPSTWKTEKGFAKHLSECKARPGGSGVWQKPAERPKTVWGICPDCGKDILENESCWPLTGKTVCVWGGCWRKYYEQGLGYHDAAGLDLGVALEG
jgi:hypothetical protein